ncbi:MAG: hypothetical protein JWO95_2870 [Verrucomicrobiales bacterium]|nr:hypothetical protein [Verrucomicrobiales bacterium]
MLGHFRSFWVIYFGSKELLSTKSPGNQGFRSERPVREFLKDEAEMVQK